MILLIFLDFKPSNFTPVSNFRYFSDIGGEKAEKNESLSVFEEYKYI